MYRQQIYVASEEYKELDTYITNNNCRTILLVCDRALPFLRLGRYFESLESRLNVKVVKFDDFEPNPVYESIVDGVDRFHKEKCDSIIAVGGGSAIDVAKCIKLFSNMDRKENFLKQTIVPNDIKLLAIPTTAGTGSESTHFAVIYYEGEKQSVSDDSCIPSSVLFDVSTLDTLSDYQRKSTMMDALCHAMEAYWSINSTEESRQYSHEAITNILTNKDAYLKNNIEGNAAMLMAANLAGKAINIAQTTAGHALCYKLTCLYGIAHGHAAALCVSKLFPFMVTNMDQCIEPRGKEFLEKVFLNIANAMGCSNVVLAINKFDEILNELNLEIPIPKEGDYNILNTSVNSIRLKNNPIKLDENMIDNLYHQILAER